MTDITGIGIGARAFWVVTCQACTSVHCSAQLYT